MARPTLWNHRKFRELEIALKSRPLAIGTLECLWRGPYDSGDPLIGTAEAVEHAACWKGKRGALVELLVKIGFLDATPRGYEVHDLLDHAPEYVRNRKRREDKRRQRSVTDPSLTHQRSVTDWHSRSEHCALSTHPPTPTRAPSLDASGGGSQATGFEQPEQQQPEQPEPPVDVGALIAGIFPRQPDQPVDIEARRELLKRQAREAIARDATASAGEAP